MNGDQCDQDDLGAIRAQGPCRSQNSTQASSRRSMKPTILSKTCLAQVRGALWEAAGDDCPPPSGPDAKAASARTSGVGRRGSSPFGVGVRVVLSSGARMDAGGSDAVGVGVEDGVAVVEGVGVGDGLAVKAGVGVRDARGTAVPRGVPSGVGWRE